MRLEGLGQLKKIHLIGTRTHDLPACSIVPRCRGKDTEIKGVTIDWINER
jgi:hypothetical protein